MRRFLLPALFLATALIVVFWVALRDHTTPPRVVQIEPTPTVASVVEPADPSAPAFDPPPPVDPLPAASTPEGPAAPAFEGLTAANAEAAENAAASFLGRNGEIAPSLLALHTATGNRKYMEQALQRFPKSPVVLYAALAETDRGDARRKLIEQFKAADPNNPLPWIFAAEDLFHENRAAEAIEEIREALKRPGLYTYFTDRANALRELLRESGATEFVAESAGFFSQRLPHLQAATAVSRGLQAYLDEQIASGDNARVADGLKLLYETSQMLGTPESSRLLIGQLVSLAMEQKALEIASSLETNPLPITPAPRIAEINQTRDESKTLGKMAAEVVAKPDLWKDYFARFRADGELSALRWVQQQTAAGR